jgi:hypothetical protein
MVRRAIAIVANECAVQNSENQWLVRPNNAAPSKKAASGAASFWRVRVLTLVGRFECFLELRPPDISREPRAADQTDGCCTSCGSP